MPKKLSGIGTARQGNTVASQLTLPKHILKRQRLWHHRSSGAERLQVRKAVNGYVPLVPTGRAGQGAMAGRQTDDSSAEVSSSVEVLL